MYIHNTYSSTHSPDIISCQTLIDHIVSGNYFLNRDDTAMVDYGFIDAPPKASSAKNGVQQQQQQRPTSETKDSNGNHNTNYSRGNEPNYVMYLC